MAGVLWKSANLTLGRRNRWPKPVLTFHFRFDMSEAPQDFLAGFNAVLNQVTAWMEAENIQNLPVEVFPVAEVGAAFRHLAQGKNVGKVVLSFPLLSETREKRRRSNPMVATGSQASRETATSELLNGWSSRECGI